MPSGAKKRKAAKKKKVNDSFATNPHQAGENDGGKLSSPNSQDPSVEVEKREDSSSENKSKDANEKEANIDIQIRSKSKSSSSSDSSDDDDSHIVEKNIVVLESVPENFSPTVDPVKPVDSLLDEVSQVFDEIKNEKKKDLVVEETRVVVEEQTVVVSESVKENEVEKLLSLDEKALSVSKDCVSSSMPPENLIREVNGADCANETDTNGHSNRQAPADSRAVAVQSTTTWKSCCGIFELFSRSER